MSNEEKKTFGQKMTDCGHFCYDSNTGEVLGRTGKSWALIGLFYLVYYGALAGFFAICLTGFFATLDDRGPTQKKMQSLLKQNPGMGFRPVIDVTSTFIRFNANETKSYEEHVKNLNDSLKLYRTSAGENVVDCLGPDAGEKDDSKVCNFPLSLLGDRCTAENNYGYSEGKPCILLKMNKVFDWKPNPFDNETAGLPKALIDRVDPDYVGVTCEGEADSDVDNIKQITFSPDKGFPIVFYPYLNQPGYLPPVVMAQFEVVQPGRFLMIWCRVWAHNIKHHRHDLQGSVHFELLVDYKV